MNKFQLENLYKVNGLKDYKVRTTDDLLKTYGINFKAVEGYSRLDDGNKRLYEKFIVNIFDGLGLDSRRTMIPKGIYFVEDFDYIITGNPDANYFTVAGGLVKIIDKDGSKTVHRSWKNQDCKHLEMIEGKTKTYLRFEYEHERCEGWMQVTDPKSWY